MDAIIRGGEIRLTQDDLRRLSVQEKRELVLRQLTQGGVTVEGTAAQRKGYVTIAASDGSVRQVPHTQARTAYYAPGSIQLSAEERRADFVTGTVPIRPEVHRIDSAVWGDKTWRRRDPLERVESLTRRYVQSWKEGKMTDALLKEMEGEYWKAGYPVSAERLRQIAARGLERTTRANQVDSQHRTTKPGYGLR